MHARFPLAIGVLVTLLTASLLPTGSVAAPPGAPKTPTNEAPSAKDPLGGTTKGFSKLERVYRDESHCLTAADMRGDQDKRISCFCRDAIIDARYLYRYLSKDSNLSGVFLAMLDHVEQQCGKAGETSWNDVATRTTWKWDGPEIVRTYPPDDVISRIEPRSVGGKIVVRSVPFTVQLIYRNENGKITRTENYSSVEEAPEFK
jgi:hypothetical protein